MFSKLLTILFLYNFIFALALSRAYFRVRRVEREMRDAQNTHHRQIEERDQALGVLRFRYMALYAKVYGQPVNSIKSSHISVRAQQPKGFRLN